MTNFMIDADRLFTDLTKHFIGVDRWRSMVSDAYKHLPSFPPYDVTKQDNKYAIRIALAGYSPEDIDVSVQDGVLSVSSAKKQEEEEQSEMYLWKGIAKRSFALRWSLDEQVEVAGAVMADGMLTVTLERHVPEKQLPKKIPIAAKALEDKTEE